MQHIINGIQRYKHRLATIALLCGFFVDLVTFRTINLTLSQIILLVHLVIVAGSILILNIPIKENPSRAFSFTRSWIPVAQQYSMGNLLSAFLVLYSASGSIATSWPFLLVVLTAAVGNETIKLQKYRLPFQTTLLFFNLLLFSALAVPIALNGIGIGTFLVSVLVASFAFSLFLHIGRVVARSAFKTNWLLIRAGWAGVAAFIVFGYFTNAIPPIPLSVKEASPYYAVERFNGSYVVERESRHLLQRFFDWDGESLKIEKGDSAYVFTSIFAPANFSENVVHRWQFYDSERALWQTSHTVRFPIVGGRHGGYRGFSQIDDPAPGDWRVSIETTRGQVLGRVYFSVVRVSAPVKKERLTL